MVIFQREGLVTTKNVLLVKVITEDVLIFATIRAALLTGHHLITLSFALVTIKKCSILLIAKLASLLVMSKMVDVMKIVTGHQIPIGIVPVIRQTFLTLLTQLTSTVHQNSVNSTCTVVIRKLLAPTRRTVLFVNVTALLLAMGINVPCARVMTNAGHIIPLLTNAL